MTENTTTTPNTTPEAPAFQPVRPDELDTPHLSPLEKQALLLALNSVGAGLPGVTVSCEYRKQTDTEPRRANQDYLAIPGVTPLTHIGPLVGAFRLVDNAKNRRAGVVGQVRIRMLSFARANGIKPSGFVSIIPSGLRSFAVLGFQPDPGVI